LKDLPALPWISQRYDLQLTRYDDHGWRATFHTTGMEHSPTRATGHQVGAHAVARDAAGGAEGVKEQRRMPACARKHDYVATGPGSPVAQPIV
jgi:hypothetical protein